MDITAVIDPLNDAQREAVSSPQQHMLVLAGAGSGKTRVLVHRIAWLMQVEHIHPHSILAVTFTNKAAKEMRGRVESLLHLPTRGMWIGTFHGLAHRFLRAHWKDADLAENFQIIDADDQLRIIKRLMKLLDVDESKWAAKQVQYFINAQKDEGVRSANLEEAHDPYHRVMHRLYQAYEEYCQSNGLVDFGEILLRSHELWLRKPELLRHYQQRFQHILVDEFQDTNAIQYAWLRVLAGDSVPMTIVGDDDQSIYGWRGARIENIHRFQTEMDNVKLVKLEQNYRSTETILNAANAVIANNSGRLGKDLWTDSVEGDPIELYAAFNEQDEAAYIVDRVKKLMEEGGARSDVAVLYRSNAQSRVLEEAFLRQGIPYRVYGGQRFYDRMEIKNALAYLRVLRFPHDDTALERIINVPPRGIGNKSLANIRQLALEQGCSMWQAAQRLLQEGAIKGRGGTGLRELVDMVETLAEQSRAMELDELVEKVIKQSKLLDYHASEKGEKGQARKENLQELVNAVADLQIDEETDPLTDFLSQAALDAGDHQADEYQDSVQLMTLHSAKGLEFPHVFLTGMEEELFPHAMSMEEPGRLEEERRLCYVGMTRAMRQLVMTFAECRRLYGQEKYHGVSRFVREIPGELLEEVRLRSVIRRPVSFGGPSIAAGASAESPAFNLGQRVRHPMFGEGVVLTCEGQGAHARIQINFQDEGTKWLVLSYAKLEPV